MKALSCFFESPIYISLLSAARNGVSSVQTAGVSVPVPEDNNMFVVNPDARAGTVYPSSETKIKTGVFPARASAVLPGRQGSS